MSATHDSVFKTGTHSSRHTPLRDSLTLRWLALHGAAASLGGDGRVTRACSSLAASPIRTEHASSPTRVPSRTRLGPVHWLGPRRPFHRSGPELGASPRWSRPTSPTRVNGLGYGDGPKHLSLSSLLTPLRWGRARFVVPFGDIVTSQSPSSERRRKHCSVLFSTGPGCVDDLGPDPSDRCPLTRTAVRSSRGAELRCRRSDAFALLPRSPLPGTLVTAPGSSRFGPPRHRPNRSRPS